MWRSPLGGWEAHTSILELEGVLACTGQGSGAMRSQEPEELHIDQHS